jgi:plastocyanin
MTFRSQLVGGSRVSWLLTLSLAGALFAPYSARGAVPEPTATPPPVAAACVGDCNHDASVTVDELLTMVNIALGVTDVSACSAGDANDDGRITVDEILSAVNNALNACPTAAPTATPVTHTVVVGPGGTLVFSPSALSIHVGDTVQWTWASSGHSVNSGSSNCVGDGRFCSPNDSNCAQAPLSNQGATYSHTFTAAGTYPYFCRPHCEFGMAGTITVQ